MDYRRVARKSEHQYNREYSAGYRQCDETVIREPEHAVYNDRLVTFAGEFLSRGRSFAVNGSTLSAAFAIRVRPDFGAAASIRSSHIPSVCPPGLALYLSH